MTPEEMVNIINSPATKDTPFYILNNLLDKNDFEKAILCIQQYFGCDIEIALKVLTIYQAEIYNVVKKIERI